MGALEAHIAENVEVLKHPKLGPECQHHGSKIKRPYTFPRYLNGLNSGRILTTSHRI